MIAIIRRGNKIGEQVEIGQWCNDWFSSLNTTHIFAPSSLAFTEEGMAEILDHENNGTLFDEFKVCQVKRPKLIDGVKASYSFKRK